MKFFRSAVLIFATILSLNAVARETVPIINYDNLAVATSSGKALHAAQVRQAIQAAAGAKGWSIAQQAGDKLLATLDVRGKHMIMVEIDYAADKYSLHYKDSSNMKYGERNGQPVIHPYYNKWVRELKDAIRLELLKA